MHYTSTSAFIQTHWNTTPWSNVTPVLTQHRQGHGRNRNSLSHPWRQCMLAYRALFHGILYNPLHVWELSETSHMPYPHLLYCLLIPFSVQHPLPWHWKIGDLKNNNLALTVPSYYFCSPLLLLIFGKSYSSTSSPGRKTASDPPAYLAPVLQIIAAGEMAPAWQKTQSSNRVHNP